MKTVSEQIKIELYFTLKEEIKLWAYGMIYIKKVLWIQKFIELFLRVVFLNQPENGTLGQLLIPL